MAFRDRFDISISSSDNRCFVRGSYKVHYEDIAWAKPRKKAIKFSISVAPFRTVGSSEQKAAVLNDCASNQPRLNFTWEFRSLMKS